MPSKSVTALTIVLSVAIWEIGLRQQLVSSVTAGSGEPAAKDNAELARMYSEDQADRSPKDGKPIDWRVVGPRDKERLKKMRELYSDGKLATGADYYHAAMLLQHSDAAADFLLAHELSVVAVSKGEERAKWLAAATEDRFLTNIGRPQRFGTQYRADGPDQPYRLCKVENGVTDGLRRAYNAPTLEQAKAREAEMNEKPAKSK
ncbi:hypothetical protein [Frigoriglobus tundricola]|uniref:Uncharacterized protein n=1 Tax=Frigoriglobus tundricola TaxID=2774151 RepID=A0A6M5YJ72_9BACT|nr:hypothetical protein [Frigoriglobus tundricola]QJW94097.1 hypothetical protein FTUN_1616 [Frigoriglobus tundricola]